MAELKKRHTTLQVTYDGTDISRDLAEYLTGFSYLDHAGGKADDLQIIVEDRDRLWSGSWFPTKGAILKATIVNNLLGVEKTLHCGTFAVDELTAQGAPNTVTIKAVSSLMAKGFKRVGKSREWENITLGTIVKRIASEHGLSVFYQVDEDPSYTRLDQREESDLAFLNRICRDNDFSLKLSDETLIVFHSRTLEQAASVWSLKRGTDIADHSFASKTFDVFKDCEVSYMDPGKKELQVYTFTPDDAPSVEQTLKSNRRVESLAQAQRLAKSLLRQKNKQEITGRITTMGNTVLLAGLTCDVAGVGVFSGKYIIDEARHTYSKNDGYATEVSIRKVLSW